MESSFSAIARLAWMNAATYATLLPILTSSGRRSTQGRSSHMPLWIDPSHVLQHLGWSLPTQAELDIAQYFGNQIDLWFSSQLRICPLCVEGSYHSVWHQFIPLTICPMHNCALITHCQNCTAPLPSIKLGSHVINTHFRCAHCRKPIAGVSPSFDAFLDFRVIAPQLDQVFSPFTNWSQHYRDATPALQRTREVNDVKHWRENPAAADLLRSFCYAEHPWSDICSPPIYRNLSVIACRVGSKSLANELGHYENSIPRFSCHAVYRATLRRLQTWIIGRRIEFRHKVDQGKAERLHMMKGRWNEVDIQAWTPKELAYMLLRYREHGGRQWEVRGDVRSAVHAQQLARVFHGQPISCRAEFRVRVLKDYVGLFHHLTGRFRHRYRFIPDIIRSSASYVLTYEELDHHRTRATAIIFPTIPDFPLRSFGGDSAMNLLDLVGERHNECSSVASPQACD
ncbi:MAG TPA: hypothetical protein VEC35_17140 [Noviherbaspirillum sp.]|nr:hypothetical protein [Noviherbaspirillum sp.]